MQTAAETDKTRIRREMAALLARKYPSRRHCVSEELWRRLDALPALGDAPVIVAFCAFRQEPELQPWLDRRLAEGRRLLLPRFNAAAQAYELVRIASADGDLTPGFYGIPEPRADLPPESAVPAGALWLVPGLAFTPRGLRLGRGKGFYDRLLAAHPGGRLVGLAFDCQILPDLPHSPWDIPMDWVVTPTRSMTR